MTLADLLPEMLTKGELSQVVAPKLVETTSVKQFWACRVLLLADHSPEGNISMMFVCQALPGVTS